MPDPQPPPFAFEDEAREALAGAARSFSATPGAACLSLRWNRSGATGLLLLSRGTVEWLSTADATGSAEWRLHRDIYLRRVDIAAIVRSRPVFSTALACLPAIRKEGLQLSCDPEDAPVTGGAIRCAAAAPPGSQMLSAHVLAALDGAAACLLAGRGLLATGRTLQAATDLAMELEALAQIHVQVLQLQVA